VDWTISYLRRHANDPKRPAAATDQPSLFDALEGAQEGGEAIEQTGV
jgi:hypothetical protein